MIERRIPQLHLLVRAGVINSRRTKIFRDLRSSGIHAQRRAYSSETGYDYGSLFLRIAFATITASVSAIVVVSAFEERKIKTFQDSKGDKFDHNPDLTPTKNSQNT
jgi:hypothetical protein